MAKAAKIKAPPDPDALPELSIATDKVCFVALKARQFDV